MKNSYNLNVYVAGKTKGKEVDEVLHKWSTEKVAMTKKDALELLQELSDKGLLEFNVLLAIMTSIGVLSYKQAKSGKEQLYS